MLTGVSGEDSRLFSPAPIAPAPPGTRAPIFLLPSALWQVGQINAQQATISYLQQQLEHGEYGLAIMLTLLFLIF